jgi:hypothetical protein
MVGGILGFLWFNCHPAQVFMGNTGALPLGGLLGTLAVVARQELLLMVVGGVFVAEALSVIMQVGYFKWRGQRLFRCAPLHHHFQFAGWPENKIVVRFWIAAALCALIGVGSLRLGATDSNTPPSDQRYANLVVNSPVLKNEDCFPPAGRQGRQPMRAADRLISTRSGWSPDIVKAFTIFGISNTDGCSQQADLPGFDRSMDLPSSEPTQAIWMSPLRK